MFALPFRCRRRRNGRGHGVLALPFRCRRRRNGSASVHTSMVAMCIESGRPLSASLGFWVDLPHAALVKIASTGGRCSPAREEHCPCRWRDAAGYRRRRRGSQSSAACRLRRHGPTRPKSSKWTWARLSACARTKSPSSNSGAPSLDLAPAPRPPAPRPPAPRTADLANQSSNKNNTSARVQRLQRLGGNKGPSTRADVMSSLTQNDGRTQSMHTTLGRATARTKQYMHPSTRTAKAWWRQRSEHPSGCYHQQNITKQQA